MGHVFEAAVSGRATCRGCGERIAKGEWRVGERSPNPFGDGEMTVWLHPDCAAYKRPEVLLEILGDVRAAAGSGEPPAPDLGVVDRYEQVARFGVEHRRVPRIKRAERAPSGRARCRSCRELIAKDAWRIALVFYESGRFEPSGAIHVGCANDYFETTEILDRLATLTPELGDEDRGEIESGLG